MPELENTFYHLMCIINTYKSDLQEQIIWLWLKSCHYGKGLYKEADNACAIHNCLQAVSVTTF